MPLRQDKMDIKIISEKENKLFKRKEIEMEAVAEVTPSNVDVEKFICDKFSIEADQLKIKGIYGSFGVQKFKILANIYDSFEDKDKTEVKAKKVRDAEKKAYGEELKKIADERKATKEANEKEEAEKKEAEAKPVEAEEKAPAGVPRETSPEVSTEGKVKAPKIKAEASE